MEYWDLTEPLDIIERKDKFTLLGLTFGENPMNKDSLNTCWLKPVVGYIFLGCADIKSILSVV